jgi:serpin B
LMRLIALSLVLLLVAGCVSAPAAPSPTPGSPGSPGPTLPPEAIAGVGELRGTASRLPEGSASDAELAALVAADTDFALRLYRQLLADEDGNVFISPYSISTALSMAYAGAEGATASQIGQALGIDLESDAWHAARNRLELTMLAGAVATLPPDWTGERLTLDPTNTIFGQAGFPFHDEYLDRLAAYYGAAMQTVDFTADPELARGAINRWVAARTRDRIEELLAQGTIDELTTAVLVNAIYFKGSWLTPFDEQATAARPFHMLDGSARDVPTMHAMLATGYATGDGWQAVRLPYLGASMLVIVPEAGRFGDIEGRLDAAFLADLTSRLSQHQVTLSLPKWESESSLTLPDALRAMGMIDAFDADRADFNGMAPLREIGEQLYISDVIHQANVTVDEKGTEAAAATAVVFERTSGGPELPRVELAVDRPFLYLIRDDATGEMLFMGRLLAP